MFKNPNPKLSDVLSVQNLERRIKEGYISVSKLGTLSIYCYTKSAQYEQVWDHETTTCRGLVVDSRKRVLARPFPKFFNYGQVEIPGWTQDVTPEVTNKIDGSLGIVFWDPHGYTWRLATKGSFVSEQARVGEIILGKAINLSDPSELAGPGNTSLFEIVYPENRIVVDYGTTTTLLYLTTISNKSGADVPLERLSNLTKFGFAGRHSSAHPDQLEALAKSSAFDNQEGLVATWKRPNGPAFRMKFKNGHYLQLHSLMTKMTARKIWEILKDQGFPALEDFVKDSPDEFQTWAIETADRLLVEHARIDKLARSECLRVLRVIGASNFGGEPVDAATRKAFASVAAHMPNRHLLFKVLDGKPISEDIWKMLYPEHETPFMASND